VEANPVSDPRSAPSARTGSQLDLARLRRQRPDWHIRHAGDDHPGQLGYIASRDGILLTAENLVRLSDRIADADRGDLPPVLIAGPPGWLSGPMPATPEASAGLDAAAPAVRAIVETVARLGMELPAWTVAQIPAGWRATRNTPAGVELRVVKTGLPALEAAMITAELALTRDAHPGWSIRPAEHGGGYLGQHGGPPALFGHTLAELANAITEHERRDS
jgi:hypothetical protein